MSILGLSCHYHDAAACIMKDGRVTGAAQEERFNRNKYSPDFPIAAINYCIQAAGIAFADLECVGFYEKPYLKFSRVVIDHLRSFPFSVAHFLRSMPSWLEDRLALPMLLEQQIGYRGKIVFVKHHMAHAASAFLVSPFDEAAIITADGVGEWATSTFGIGRDNRIEILRELHYPHSLGLLYTALTTYLGFGALSGEGKVMGLASYGKPRYLGQLEQMVDLRPDGSFRIDKRYFNFNAGERMYSRRFVAAMGPAREPETEIEERHCDIAASLQVFVENAMVAIARHVHRRTGLDQLCLAGGVFLNCVLNHKILERTPFQKIFVQPAAGDAGGALGAAALIYNSMQGHRRDFVLDDAALGPSFTNREARRALRFAGLEFHEMNEDALAAHVADRLVANKIVGWVRGRMEFGPRALGRRSILANPTDPNAKERLNKQVKRREEFRPYAPVVLQERASEFFELLDDSPFMLLAAPVREEKRALLPTITHVDGSARVQTLRKEINPELWSLIHEFEKRCGVPMVVNTSFNLRGEPIVCTPHDAIDCFQRSGMDALVLGNCVVG